MNKDPRVYLAHILERIERIEQGTAGGQEQFNADPMLQDAVFYNFTIIGEAAKRLDEDFRAGHPTIPWRGLAGLRDILIHQYEGVDLARVWAIVRNDLPGLKRAIAGLLPPLDELERELAGDD
jgi:uncharacterized protein with HEPN domain